MCGPALLVVSVRRPPVGLRWFGIVLQWVMLLDLFVLSVCRIEEHGSVDW